MSFIDLEDLKKERKRLMKRLGLVDSLIDEYAKKDPELDFEHFLRFDSRASSEQLPLFSDIDDFPRDSTWLKQVLYLLEKHERFLGNTEMAEFLLPYYPDKNVDKLKRRVSVVISGAFKSNRVKGLVKLKISALPQGFVWGFKNWLDSSNDIIQKHRPIKHQKSPMLWG